MSSNSLSFTNLRDGVFNKLYLINENGEIEDIKDLLSTSLNDKAPKHNPEFTGTVTLPDNSLSIDDVDALRSILDSKAGKLPLLEQEMRL